jgi:hypothetical protein
MIEPFEWDASREDAQLGCYLLILLRSVLAGNSGQASYVTNGFNKT